MKCACPCGEEFEPSRSNQIYFNGEHRKRDKNRRWPVKRQFKDRATSRSGPQSHQQAQTSGVTPLQGTEMAQTKRERLKAKNGRRASTELLTSFEVADRLGLSPWALTAWRRHHKGPPFVRVGRKTIRYPRRDFDEWLASLPRK